MVNTFVVDKDFKKSAQMMDSRRLGKQRVEAFQILNLIENIRLISELSGIYYKISFHSFVVEIKKWYQKQDFVLVVSGDFLIRYPKSSAPTKLNPDERLVKMGFCTHPIVEMWYGYEDALKEYIDAHIVEWMDRGYKNTMKIYNVRAKQYPEWCGWDDFHENHRGALIKKELDRKEKPWYQLQSIFVDAKAFEDYIWVKNHVEYDK
jgi:hypothetical protein